MSIKIVGTLAIPRHNSVKKFWALRGSSVEILGEMYVHS